MMQSSLTYAPLTSLDDFLMKSARFQIPNFNDPKRTFNRICNNLIYYQTNYFFMSLIVFLFVGIFQSAAMIPFSLMTVAVLIVYSITADVLLHHVGVTLLRHFTTARTSEENSLFSRKLVELLCTYIKVVGFFVILVKFWSILIFMFGVILLCLFLILIHASLRLRNSSNKIANKAESMGFVRTPMGLLLSHLNTSKETANKKK